VQKKINSNDRVKYGKAKPPKREFRPKTIGERKIWKTAASSKRMAFSINKEFLLKKTPRINREGWVFSFLSSLCQSPTPYDCPQQEWPESVLLFLASAIPLNENSTHPFYGVLRCFHGPQLPKCQPIENDVKRNDFIEHRLNPETNTAETGGLAHSCCRKKRGPRLNANKKAAR